MSVRRSGCGSGSGSVLPSSGVMTGMLELRFFIGRQCMGEKNAGRPASFALTAVRAYHLFGPEVISEQMRVVALEFIHLIRSTASPITASFNPHVWFLPNSRARMACRLSSMQCLFDKALKFQCRFRFSITDVPLVQVHETYCAQRPACDINAADDGFAQHLLVDVDAQEGSSAFRRRSLKMAKEAEHPAFIEALGAYDHVDMFAIIECRVRKRTNCTHDEPILECLRQAVS